MDKENGAKKAKNVQRKWGQINQVLFEALLQHTASQHLFITPEDKTEEQSAV